MSQQFWNADPNDFNETQPNGGSPQQAVDDILKAIASDPLLCAAVASMGLALGLQFAGRPKAAGLIGLGAPTLLFLSLYRRSLRDTDAMSRANRRREAGRRLDEHFRGGCASPPDEVGDVDDYSECISRPHPHKAK